MSSAHLDSSIIVLDDGWDDDSTICSHAHSAHGVTCTLSLRGDGASTSMAMGMRRMSSAASLSSAGLSSVLNDCGSSVCSESVGSTSAAAENQTSSNNNHRLPSPSPLSGKTPMILSLPAMSQRSPSVRRTAREMGLGSSPLPSALRSLPSTRSSSSSGGLVQAPSLIVKRVSFSLTAGAADTCSRSPNDLSFTHTSSSSSCSDESQDNTDDNADCEIANPLTKHIYEIASRHEMTPDEIAATWYSLEEVDGMKDAMRHDSRVMREIVFDATNQSSSVAGGGTSIKSSSGSCGDPDGPDDDEDDDDDDDEHCARGLEHLFTRDSLIRKQQSRSLAVHAVLAAQDQGVVCSDQLASISRKFTLPARIYAAQMGSLDATKVRAECSSDGGESTDGSMGPTGSTSADPSSSLASHFERQASLSHGYGDNTVTSTSMASASNFSYFDGDIDNNKALELHQMEAMRQRNRAMHVKTVNDFMASSLAELAKERDPRVIQEVTQMLFTSMSNMTAL